MEQAAGSHLLPFINDVINHLIDMGHAMLEESDCNKLVKKLEALLPTIADIHVAASPKFLGEDPLKDLQDAVYAADDVLDNIEYKILEERRKTGESGQLTPDSPYRYSIFSSASENISSVKNYDEVDCLKKCIRKVLDAAERCTALPNHTSGQYSQLGISMLRNSTSTYNGDMVLFARDTELQHLLDNIEYSDDPHYRFGVGTFPVVGISGVGKSALTRVAFNHESTKREFSVRMWVCVSDHFDIRDVMLQMIMAAKGDKQSSFNSDSSLDSIQNTLTDVLKEKRFLLVLDDVVDISLDQWKNMQKVVKSAARRSLIIVTTQSKIVANTVSTTELLNMSKLPGKGIWRLFHYCALDGTDFIDQQEQTEEMLRIPRLGEDIANKLKGLPLSARALGRALHGRKEESHWRHVLERTLWEQHEDGIPPALWLSYQHLNPILKQCFAYCSVFPQNCNLEKEKVVQMWGAQGLIPTKVGEIMEHVGMDIFLELTDRGFFQSTGNGRYVMHNLMRGLAQKVSCYDCFTVTDVSEHVPQDVRHLTIRTANVMKINKDLGLSSSASDSHFLNHLRTLLFFGEYSGTADAVKVIDQLFSKLRSIRVLKLPFPCKPEVLKITDHFKHMRYLDFSGNFINDINKLPKSICHLYHIQVLDFRHCPKFSPPWNIISLMNLRHLYASTHTLSLISQIQSLTSLQELETFSAGSKSGIEALRGMTQLQGTLHIEDLHHVKHGETKNSILRTTRCLKKLCLSWGHERTISQETESTQLVMDEQLLECLQPHENLEELEIVRYPGTGYPFWMLQRHSLKNIKCVRLSNCSQWKFLSPWHLLPNLEVLEIKEMQSIEKSYCINNGGDLSEEFFPKLKKLVLRDLPVWTGWKINAEMIFPCLHELELRNCPQFTYLPYVPLSLEVLIIENVGIETLPVICEDKSCAELDGSTRRTSSLISLYVNVCPKLKSLATGLFQQQQLLKSLRSIEIRNCDILESGGIDGFKDIGALADLSICDCPKLSISQFPESLRTIEISECFIKQGGWLDVYPHLFSVFTVKISGCSHFGSDQKRNEVTLDWMDSLFKVYILLVKNTSLLRLEIFDKLRNIKLLEIDGCKAFFDSNLQFQSFRGLILLSITNCTDLPCLPEDLSSLPFLEELCVDNCPLISTLPNSGFPHQQHWRQNRCEGRRLPR